MLLWTIGGLVGMLALAGMAVQIAIWRNGPAVLDTVDRIAGDSDAALIARGSTGDHPQQKVIVWGSEARTVDTPARPVLLYVHGGSWNSGDPDDYGFVGRAFVPKGFVVVLAGYRLGENGRYPAMIEDTASAIAWTHREIAQHGGDPQRIVIAGHSAGAYNVMMTALEERWLAPHGLSPDHIAGVVGLAGPYDFHPFTSDATKAAFGHAEDPETTQPVNRVNGTVRPTLLIHGEQDTLVYPRNSRVLAARKAEVDQSAVQTVFYDDFDHNAPLISLAAPWRENRDVLDQITQFAKKVTAGELSSTETSVPVQAERR